jgi:hypothetical protein
MTPRKKPTKRVAKATTSKRAEEERKRKNRDYQRAYYHKRQAAKKAAAASAPKGAEALSQMTITKAIGRFLDSVRARDASGRRVRQGVVIGALAGFPQFTNDPEVIERAVEKLTAKIPETRSAVVELELRQRISDLSTAAARIRSGGAPGGSIEDREIFIAYGAAWAAARKFPITYETFREMGVPADVLRDAAIPRRPTG